MSEAFALKRFDVTKEGTSDGVHLSIHCRRRGLRAAVRTMLGLDLNVALEVKKDSIAFTDQSLFAETYHTIPITAVRGVVAGIRRPIWKLIFSAVFCALGVASFIAAGQGGLLTEYTAGSRDSELATFIGGGAAALVIALGLLILHIRQKRLFIEFEYGGSRPKGLLLQRSWRVLVHVPKVREAVALVNDLVVSASAKSPQANTVITLAPEEVSSEDASPADGPALTPVSTSS
jgi:hypothetical protein